MLLPLDKIRTDGGTQPRVGIDFDAVGDYSDAMSNGVVFPPVVVFYDGSEYWLADGFHRCKAAFGIGRDEIACDVKQGTREDAQWYSFSANKTNGLRRTNDDKQRAVKAALMHPQGAGKSDGQIASHVGVSVITVGRWRDKLGLTITKLESGSRVGRDGRTINTSNIGKHRQATIPLVPLPPVSPASTSAPAVIPECPMPAPATRPVPVAAVISEPVPVPVPSAVATEASSSVEAVTDSDIKTPFDEDAYQDLVDAANAKRGPDGYLIDRDEEPSVEPEPVAETAPVISHNPLRDLSRAVLNSASDITSYAEMMSEDGQKNEAIKILENVHEFLTRTLEKAKRAASIG